MKSLSLRLQFPPSVNHYTVVVRGRKILSARGRQYKQDNVFRSNVRFDGPVNVHIVVVFPDRRRKDLDLLKPILDVLTESGVFADDSQVSKIVIENAGTSKPGHVDIVLEAA